MVNLLAADGNDKVTVEEFILGCKKLRGQAKSSDVASLLRENKKSAIKAMKTMRRIEAQLQGMAMHYGIQFGGGSNASWLRSRSPMSAGDGGALHTPNSVGSRSSPIRAGGGRIRAPPAIHPRRITESHSVPDLTRR